MVHCCSSDLWTYDKDSEAVCVLYCLPESRVEIEISRILNFVKAIFAVKYPKKLNVLLHVAYCILLYV